jgi:hypothetical protein
VALVNAASGNSTSSATLHTATLPTGRVVGNWLVAVLFINTSATGSMTGFNPVSITTNEKVTMAYSGDGTGDSYSISFGGQTTSSLVIPVSRATIISALQGLSTIGTGNAVVNTANATTPDPSDIYLVNDLGAKDIATTFSATGSGMTVSFTPTNGGATASSITNAGQWFVFFRKIDGTESATSSISLSASSYAGWAIYQLDKEPTGVRYIPYSFASTADNYLYPRIKTTSSGLDIISLYRSSSQTDAGTTATVAYQGFTERFDFSYGNTVTRKVYDPLAGGYFYESFPTTIAFSLADAYKSAPGWQTDGYFTPSASVPSFGVRLFISEPADQGGTGWGITT